MALKSTGLVEYGNHKIEVLYTGGGHLLINPAMFIVLYDGKEVSRKGKRTSVGSLVHNFKVIEDNQDVEYIVTQNWKTAWIQSLTVLRNGKQIYHYG